jgi:phosphate starvation-inducible protein PhoH and related proteins
MSRKSQRVNTQPQEAVESYSPEIVVKFRNKSQKLAWTAMDRNAITFLTGMAGTAKTFIAIAYALDAVYNKRTHKRIIIVRPLVDAGEDPGALPGTLEEKADPYLQPIHDALDKICSGNKSKLKPIITTVVQPKTLGTMRGLTFDDAICVLDEAQNATKTQLRMFLTRQGENCKLILSGDCDQSDIGHRSVLEKTARVLSSNEGIGWFQFAPQDNCRNPMNLVVEQGMKEV